MRDIARGSAGEAGDEPVPAIVRASGVAVAEPDDVAAFLRTRPERARGVVRLARAARERLGPETSLALALVRDPERGEERLALFARQAPYAPDLLDVLDRIADEAAAAGIAPDDGGPLLTTDFGPPS